MLRACAYPLDNKILGGHVPPPLNTDTSLDPKKFSRSENSNSAFAESTDNKLNRNS